MNISSKGIDLLKDAEGFRSKAYLDTGGVWTVGYGTTRITDRPVNKDDVVDELYAVVLMLEDIASSVSAVNRLVTVPLTQNQFDALVDFVYNLGESQFLKSTLLRLLNTKDYLGASKEFRKWVFDNGVVQPGLVSRRYREEQLFLS
jgi:lysozyme